MPSPFPGMDPYLEGEEWHDAHQRLATEISDYLAPQLRPHYIVRLAVAVVPDLPHAQEIEVMYPDVEILRRKRTPEPAPPPFAASGVAEMTPTITKPVILPLPVLKVRLVTVEIRETETHRLVTSIELLSPVNKRKPGIAKFLEKRARLLEAGVHLVDIDLIRRGKRPVHPPAFTETHPLAQAHYSVMLTRAKANQIELWPIRLQEKLPIIAIPLRPSDPDVPLDLGAIFTAIYDKAGYDLSLDYSQAPPPPALDAATQTWIDDLLKAYR
jgi:hypothetical protein